MGWSSGTDIAESIAAVLVKYVPKEKLVKAASQSLEALREADWDCEDEVDLFRMIYLMENEAEDWEEYDDQGEIEDAIKDLKNLKKQFEL